MLNYNQEQVVNSNENKILCLAGAGTGKTHCMIERIIRLINDGADPQSILVLTFTNAAAFEMKSRYEKRCDIKQSPTFKTFHAFCYSLIIHDTAVRNKVGYSSIPSIATEAEAKRILEETRLQTGLKLKSLDEPKELSQSQQADYKIFKKAYQRLLTKNNLITFDYMCDSVCKLFVSDDDCVKQYKDKYKYVCVDEFQDTDKRQYEFISSFKDSSLFVVGDALQSLYAFRGADSTLIKSLAVNKEWTTYKLDINYRCGEPICMFANRIFSDELVYKVKLRPNRSGGQVDELIYPHLSKRGQVPTPFLEKCLEICKNADEEEHIAILCRTNSEVDCVIDYFKDNNVDIDAKQENYLSHILKSASDNTYFKTWFSTLLKQEDYAEYVRTDFINGEVDFRKFELSQIAKQTLDQIEMIESILSDNMKSEFEKVSMIAFSLELEEDQPDTLDEFYNKYMNVENTVTSKIYAGTIHSSKGLEYDRVILLGVDGVSFPLSNEENLNCYYVGCTRAKNNLHVMRYTLPKGDNV